MRFCRAPNRGPSSAYQVPNDRDDGKNQKQVNQAAGYMESSKPEYPKHEQNNRD